MVKVTHDSPLFWALTPALPLANPPNWHAIKKLSDRNIRRPLGTFIGSGVSSHLGSVLADTCSTPLLWLSSSGMTPGATQYLRGETLDVAFQIHLFLPHSSQSFTGILTNSFRPAALKKLNPYSIGVPTCSRPQHLRHRHHHHPKDTSTSTVRMLELDTTVPPRGHSLHFPFATHFKSNNPQT